MHNKEIKSYKDWQELVARRSKAIPKLIYKVIFIALLFHVLIGARHSIWDSHQSDKLTQSHTTRYLVEILSAAEKHLDEPESLSYYIKLNQDQVTDIMHQMTHQKIKAKTKIGTIQMTPKRIAVLIQYVKSMPSSDFTHKEEILSILTHWIHHDFSYIVEEHNQLLDWEEGNIGKAYGVMSDDQEMKFILNNFNK